MTGYSEPEERLSAEDIVRTHKNLAEVERLFRTLKGIDLKARPIRRRTEERARAHIFLCTLAYYVEWHMRKALSPIIYDDQEPDKDRLIRDPVLPAKPSQTAKQKKMQRVTSEAWPYHSFDTLLKELATCCRNTCSLPASSPSLHLRCLQIVRLFKSALWNY